MIFLNSFPDEDDFCPEVAHQAGLLVTYDTPERRFNGYANFSCGEGYIYHSGSSRLRCMSNRQWGGGNEFLCIPNGKDRSKFMFQVKEKVEFCEKLQIVYERCLFCVH